MTDRQYTDEERAAIIREAARLSAHEPERHSLTEIQRIAEQADIAPDLVAKAAASLTVLEPASPSGGSAAGLHLVRVVRRAVRTDEALAALATVRRRLAQTGTTRDVGGGVEWSYDSGFSASVISIAPSAEGTVVRMESRADGRQFVLIFSAVMAAIGTGLAASTATTPALSVLAGVVAFVPYAGLARLWWRHSARATAAKLTALADEIAALLD